VVVEPNGMGPPSRVNPPGSEHCSHHPGRPHNRIIGYTSTYKPFPTDTKYVTAPILGCTRILVLGVDCGVSKD